MNNKKLKVLMFSVLITITFVAYLVHFVSFMVVYSNRWADVLLYSFLGLIITLLLAPLFHELGHLIVGLCCGFKVVSFTISFIKLTFYKKFKISLVRPYYFGETVFIPRTPKNYPNKLKYTTAGGVLFSAIYMLMGMFIVVLLNDIDYLKIVLTFGISYHVSAYVLLINVLPFKSDSDGVILFATSLKDSVYIEMMNNVLYAEAEIMCGVEPKDISAKYLTEFYVSYDYYSVMLKYLRYLAFLWRDENSAFEELFEISDLDNIPESLYETIYKELFFASIVRGDDAFIKANEEVVIGYLESDDSPSNYRIHATYRKYKGDDNWAKIIINSGLKEIKAYSGLDKFELSLLNAMKNNF